MGNGTALNLHCILYGNEDTTQSQFVSWDNMPVEARSPITVDLKHPSDLGLFYGDKVNGKHVLYDRSPDSPTDSWFSRIARLTLTYHDLVGTKYVSIFHYTIEHRWIHVVTEEITGNPARDLKELNTQKKLGVLATSDIRSKKCVADGALRLFTAPSLLWADGDKVAHVAAYCSV